MGFCFTDAKATTGSSCNYNMYEAEHRCIDLCGFASPLTKELISVVVLTRMMDLGFMRMHRKIRQCLSNSQWQQIRCQQLEGPGRRQCYRDIFLQWVYMHMYVVYLTWANFSDGNNCELYPDRTFFIFHWDCHADACIYDADEVKRVQYVYGKGRQVASHTWSHSDLTTLTWDQS